VTPLEIVRVDEPLDDESELREENADKVALRVAEPVDIEENDGLDERDADFDSRDVVESVADDDGGALIDAVPDTALVRLAVDVWTAGAVAIEERLDEAVTDIVPPIFV